MNSSTLYAVVVTAVNADGSAASSSFNITTSASTNLYNPVKSDNSFVITWTEDSVANVDTYVYKLNGSVVTPLQDNGKSIQQITFSGLSPSTPYSVTIDVTYTSGSSNVTYGPLTVTTNAQPTSFPTTLDWAGGNNVTISGNSIIKTGGVSGAQDAGQTATLYFDGPQYLTFKANNNTQYATVGIGRLSGIKKSYVRDYQGAFQAGWTIQPDGETQMFSGDYFNGTGLGPYDSNTVFGIAEDISVPGSEALVFYLNNVEKGRIPVDIPSSSGGRGMGHIINVSIATLNGGFNNFKVHANVASYSP